MILLTYCLGYHVLRQIVFWASAASYHNMWRWWYYRTSDMGLLSAMRIWR
jgi:hypothetical protein